MDSRTKIILVIISCLVIGFVAGMFLSGPIAQLTGTRIGGNMMRVYAPGTCWQNVYTGETICN